MPPRLRLRRAPVGWGQNYEQSWIEDAWRHGFSSAYDRMIEEATAVGAHGVVGLVDSLRAAQRHGRARVPCAGHGGAGDGRRRRPADGRPWTTYLAGQRLAKSIEAGYAPVSIAASVASVRVWAYCITEYLTEGSGGQLGVPGGRRLRSSRRPRPTWPCAAWPASTCGASWAATPSTAPSMITTERELGQGDAELQCILRGNRVRRFKQFDPMPSPRPTVRML